MRADKSGLHCLHLKSVVVLASDGGGTSTNEIAPEASVTTAGAQK
jgi:hypothetical protein